MPEGYVDFAAERKNRGEAPIAGGPGFTSVEPVPFSLMKKNQEVVGNQVSAIVGDKDFDRDSYAPTGLRFNLSRGDNLQEKLIRLQKIHPNGGLRYISDSLMLSGADTGLKSKELLYRESPADDWKLVNRPGLDWADFAAALGPSVESIGGELGMAALTQGKSVAFTVFKQAFGAVLGEATEQFFQSLSGNQAQTLLEQAKEVGAEGALSTFGGFAGSLLTAPKNIATGRGALQVGDSGIETIQAMGRIGKTIDEDMVPSPGMVVDNPIVQRQEKQAAQVVPGFERFYNNIVKQVQKAIDVSVPQNQRLGAIRATLNSLRDFGNKFINKLQVNKTTPTEGGLAAKTGRDEFDIVSKAIENKLYLAAERIEDPVFDKGLWTSVAKDLRVGKRGKIDAGVEDLLKQLDAINGPKELSDGMLSVTQQYRNIRTDARRLATPADGHIAGNVEGQAGEVVRAITKLLDNPVNTAPAFKQAWKAASDSTRMRHDVLDSEMFIRIARSQEPSDLLAFATPGNSTKLKLMRDAIDDRQWKVFKASFFTDLISDPKNLAKRWDELAADPDTLNVLIPLQGERAAWKKVADESRRIAMVNAEEQAFIRVGNKEFVNATLDTATPNTYFTIARAINETNDVALRDTWRSGILNWAWDGVIKFEKNSIKIDRGKLKARVAQIDSGTGNNFIRLLSKPQRQLLKDIDKVAAGLESLSDAGTSIRGMEISSNLPGEILTMSPGGATRGFLQSYAIEKLYLSKAGRYMLIGTGKSNSKGEYLRILSAAMTRVGRDVDIRLEMEESEEIK